MRICELLGICPGVTAVIGSGGKTSLLARLAEELPGTVILCTTTHIRPFPGIPLLTDAGMPEIQQTLTARRVLCLGAPAPGGKLTATALPIDVLADLADYVLVEADGSRHLPLKAHAPYEPVIPGAARQRICVAGASGFGRPIQEAVHRPALFCALTGAVETDPATPELAAQAILTEGLADTVFLNQLDRPADLPLAERFAAPLLARGVRVAAGSLRNGEMWPF